MDRLASLLFLWRFSGTKHILRIGRNSWNKARLNAAYTRRRRQLLPGGGPAAMGPGRLVRVQAIPGGARFDFQGTVPDSALEVHFLTADMVCLTWLPGALPVPYALAQTDWSVVTVTLSEAQGAWSVATPELELIVYPDGAIRYVGGDGRPLRSEAAPLRRPLAGGEFAWDLRAGLAPDEVLLGMGEQAAGLNLRGRCYCVYNSDPGGSYGPGHDPLYMPLPLYLGRHSAGSYLIFYENYLPSEFRFDPPRGNLAEAHLQGGALRFYFVAGALPHLLERYTELTGRPALPPRWAFGYHQCRWGYRSEADIRAVADGFREHDLPLSAIHLDIDYMNAYRVFTVDAQRFPDLPALAKSLDKQGIRLVTILNPGVKQDPEYFLYNEGQRHFCTLPDGRPAVDVVWPGWALFPDFTDPAARSWWGEQYDFLLRSGIAGFWHDMNEPAAFVFWGPATAPDALQHQMDGNGPHDHRHGHNLYGFLMNRAGFEGLRHLCPDRRPWILSRSGWAGQARYAWNWSGDCQSTWESLAMGIPMAIHMGLSGQPYTGPDIGGFSGEPDAELYLRWFQMATFLPFFRTHSALGTPRREPWVYGEPTTAIVRQYLRTRYHLLPYLYTLAWQASCSGHPLVRPLAWSDPHDQTLWEVEDAFLLGETLLIAPVTRPGLTVRSLRLPAGSWYCFWSDTAYNGPAVVELPVTLERMPVLVRGGSLLPLEVAGRLELHLYVGGESGTEQAVLYNDAGDGYGLSRLDRFCWQQQGNTLLLERSETGEYPFPYAGVDLILHGAVITTAWVDGEAASAPEGRLPCGLFHTLKLEILR